ncbi:hypothetical protein [Moorena sp. SIOASIH]|uniref:hypothetical protein n=1 Tax=Moorena sp. SIOASIH TaxID=2607817 RepID=UPI0025FAE499|nr:hypothetical protein [Moorena sp. SIOASIH]
MRYTGLFSSYLLPLTYSLLPTPYSLLPTPYSLFPTPYSLLPLLSFKSATGILP